MGKKTTHHINNVPFSHKSKTDLPTMENGSSRPRGRLLLYWVDRASRGIFFQNFSPLRIFPSFSLAQWQIDIFCFVPTTQAPAMNREEKKSNSTIVPLLSLAGDNKSWTPPTQRTKLSTPEKNGEAEE